MSFTRIAFADDLEEVVIISECHEFVNDEVIDTEQVKCMNILKTK